MSDGIFEGIKTYHGTEEIGEEISDTVNDINEVLRPDTVKLSNEIAIDRMNIQPFRISPNVNLIKPVLLSCERTRVNQFKLTAAPFANPGFVHTESVWQLALDSNFSVGVLELESDVQLLTALFNLVKIEYSTTYYARVKFKADAFVSPWSDTLNITTAAPLPVDTPTVDLVEQYDEEDEKKFRITSSVYHHSDPLLLHTRTVWQVSKESNFGTILKEIPDTLAPLTYAEFLIDPVESVTDYFFRVKYFSNLVESAWSLPYLLKSRLLGTIEKPVLTVTNPICPFNFTIEGSAYVVSNPEFAHTNTQWQLSTRSDFLTFVVDHTTPAEYPDLTTFIVSEALCVDQTTYYARAKYISDDLESEWSDTITCDLKMTIEDFPQRIDFTNVVTTIREPKSYLVACDKVPCLGYIDVDGNLTFDSLALDTEGNKTKLVSFPMADEGDPNDLIEDNPKDMVVCGYEKSIYQVISEKDGEGNFFWVIREFNKTTGTTTIFSSIFHTTLSGRDGAPLAVPVAMFCDDTRLWLIAENDTETLVSVINKTTKVWTRLPANPRAVNMPKGLTRYCLNAEGNLSCLTLIDYMEVLESTLTWSVPVMPVLDLVLPDYSAKVGATWDVYLAEVFPKDDTLLAIVKIVASFSPNPFFCFYSLNKTTGAWDRMSDIPGIADFVNPAFIMIDSELYVTAVRTGVILPIELKHLDVYNKSMGALYESKKPAYESCVFSHPENGINYIGLCCMDQPIENYPYVYGYSLTDPTNGSTRKFEVDFGEYGVPFNASYCYGNGKLYFCSGIYNEQYTTLLLAWDLATLTMELISSEAPASERFSMLASGDEIFFHGGYGTSWTDARVFNLTTQTWTKDLLTGLRKTDSRMVEIPLGILIYGGTNPSTPSNDHVIFLWDKTTLTASAWTVNTQTAVSDYTLVLTNDGDLLSIGRYPSGWSNSFSIWKYNGSINEPTGGAFEIVHNIPLVYEACPRDWLDSTATPDALDTQYSFTVGGAYDVLGGGLFILVNAYYSGISSRQGHFTAGGSALVRLEIGPTVETSYYYIRVTNRYEIQLKLSMNYPIFSAEPQGGVLCEFNCTYTHAEGGSKDEYITTPPLKFLSLSNKTEAIIVNEEALSIILAQMTPDGLSPYESGNLSVRARISAANLNWTSWSPFMQL